MSQPEPTGMESPNYWWNLDYRIAHLITHGITRILEDGNHAWSEKERDDLCYVVSAFREYRGVDGLAGFDRRAWNIVGDYFERLWD